MLEWYGNYYTDLTGVIMFRQRTAGRNLLRGPSLDYLFQQGSYAQWRIVDPAVPSIRITPIKYWNNDWTWFSFRTHDFAGKTPHFLIAKADRWAAYNANEYMAVWSTALDSDVWTKFDNNIIDITDYEFYHNTAFPAGEIFIMQLPAYSFSRVQSKLSTWALADPRIVDTPSTINFILGNSTARAALGNRIAPSLPFYGFKITNPSGFAKNTMILTAGNHPSETTGRWMLEGAIEWLLGGTPEAELLLNWFDIFVYPCVNPQGVWTGYFRSQPEDATKDHNRYWDVDTLECIHAFRDAFAADVGATIDVGVDFHSSLGDSYFYATAQDNTEP
jgi:hypothetical protein